jgi:hypothetical protein
MCKSMIEAYLPLLGPLSEFPGVFGYLIENEYKLEHLKSISM